MGVLNRLRPAAPGAATPNGRAMGSLFALPFVRSGVARRTQFWSPNPSGLYEVDCYIGARYGRALIEHVREFDDVQALRNVLMDIVASDDAEETRGVLVGLFGEIGGAIIGGNR